MAIAKMTTRGRITIPKRLRDELGIHCGQVLECIFENGGITFIVPKNHQLNHEADIALAAG